jgi:hypothetical protein
MWTKEAPNEPGFYWIRFAWSHPVIEPDREPTIVHVIMRDGLLVSFPGNEETARALSCIDAEWWDSPIRQPGGDLRRCLRCCHPESDKIHDPSFVGATPYHEFKWIEDSRAEKEARRQEELVTEIARELYDRFVMGGWEPQDAHEQIREWLAEARQAPTL